MRILVLGGAGFCGWPTALHLSEAGHDILIVDNGIHRMMDAELGVQSLTPIASLPDRIDAWREVSGRRLDLEMFDVAKDYGSLLNTLNTYRPDTVVHFAEQRAAPYSMKDAAHKCYTVDNNVNATHNVLAALVEAGLDTHVVHLGTMGVYGYETSAVDLPEGYLAVSYPDRHGAVVTRDVLYPTSPAASTTSPSRSINCCFQFYAQNDGVRITDLHQASCGAPRPRRPAVTPG
jgi:UDP-sulfoquinovose synthase